MLRSSLILLLAIFLSLPAQAVPFWGALTSEPAGTDPATLEPGQFVWQGEAVPAGPVVVVVSLAEQRAYVYRNGVRIGATSVSSGKPGYATPTGVFTVLQKDKDHRSKKYNNAAMPYTERLTWDGVALHAGGLPGYPSSHGCVHLPSEFARQLFAVSPMGMTVVVAAEHSAPVDVVHPAAIAPIDATSGAATGDQLLADGERYRWQPKKAPRGPLSIVVSTADRRALVYRNGVEIGRARLTLADARRQHSTHAYVMQAGQGAGASPVAPERPAHRWVAVSIPGHAGGSSAAVDPAQGGFFRLPAAFAAALYAALEPGATLLVTDAPVLPAKTTNVALNILNADPPAD
jgi:hypothetical protein